jgi:hypothetical protein
MLRDNALCVAELLDYSGSWDCEDMVHGHLLLRNAPKKWLQQCCISEILLLAKWVPESLIWWLDSMLVHIMFSLGTLAIFSSCNDVALSFLICCLSWDCKRHARMQLHVYYWSLQFEGVGWSPRVGACPRVGLWWGNSQVHFGNILPPTHGLYPL